MFGIGSTELLVILLVALIVLGPKSLAGFSRKLGQFIGEFRRVSTDFQRTLNLEAAEEEARLKAEKDRAKDSTAEDSKNQAGAGQTANPFNKVGGMEDLPPDSPLAQAVAKARAEAEAAEKAAAEASAMVRESVRDKEMQKEQAGNGHS